MSMEQPGGPVTLEPDGVTDSASGVIFVVPVVVLVALIFGGWQLALFVVIIAVIAALVFLLEDIKAAFVWRQARLDIPQALFELGATPVVTYRRDSKRVRDVGSCVVDFTLLCRETVTYRQGTDTKTERTTVFSKKFSASGEGTASGVAASVEIEIPVDRGAPSFKLSSNKVEWFIDTEVHGEGLPKDDQRFDIEVAPVLQRAQPGRVQDS